MSGFEVPRFDIDDPVLAHAAWSRIAEPGDLDAGRLIAAGGPSQALRWLYRAADAALDPGEHPGLSRAVARWRPRLTNLDPRRELAVLARLGGRLVTCSCSDWPAPLADLGAGAPHCLWLVGQAATGSLAQLCERTVAIVGTRAATAYGEFLAGDLAAQLAAQGLTIVSGGAYGIDAAAHRGALAAGGVSIAIGAGGLDRLYPAGNADLLEEVGRTGALISEVPPGSSPQRFRFLQRNRLIAALGQVTVVVEAAWRSGAQNTARHAVELLRPVAALPGPVTSAASAGCHRLIREGAAVLVSDVGEILELIDEQGPAQGELFEDDGAAQITARRVLEAMPARSQTTVDTLARAVGLGAADVLGALGRLELEGRVESSAGRWRRC